MALFNCVECDRKISDTAVACPGCGAPVSPPVRNTLLPDWLPEPDGREIAIGTMALLALGGALAFFLSGKSRR